MKILIATQCFPPDLGGIEHVMGNIAIEASEAKHTVFVVSDKSKSPSRDFDDKNNYIIFRFGQIKYFRKLKKANYINHLLATQNFDLIFFDSWKSLEHVDSTHQSEKFVCLVHGNEILKDKNRDRVMENMSKANSIIFNSNATKLLFQKKYVSFKIKNSKVIYPAFISSIQKPDEKKKKYDFCTIGRLERRKGHQLILQALKKLRDTDNIVSKYAILGEGDELSRLKSDVLKYSLQNQVDFFIGEERGKILKQSKIHVMPTFLDGNSIEGFGISNVEASAYGLPCIVSSSGGTQESIIKNETGLVIQEKNVEQLYKAMKVLIQDEVKYMHLSSNSLTFAGSFLKENKVIEYLEIL